jgi:hypothetical protein
MLKIRCNELPEVAEDFTIAVRVQKLVVNENSTGPASDTIVCANSD